MFQGCSLASNGILPPERSAGPGGPLTHAEVGGLSVIRIELFCHLFSSLTELSEVPLDGRDFNAATVDGTKALFLAGVRSTLAK